MISHPPQILTKHWLINWSLHQWIKEIPIAKKLNEPTHRMTHALEVIFQNTAAAATSWIDCQEALDFITA